MKGVILFLDMPINIIEVIFMGLINQDLIKWVTMEIIEGSKNNGSKWEKSILYGKGNVPFFLMFGWITVVIVGIYLVCKILDWTFVIGTMTSAANWYYTSMKILLSIVFLMDFMIRTKKLYFAMTWGQYPKSCKAFTVFCYILFALNYEIIIFFLIWDWSLSLIVREIYALVQVSLIVYVVSTFYVAFSYQRYRTKEIEIERQREKSKINNN